MPLFGPPNIEKLKERRDVKGLIKALRHNDVFLRKDAALALGEIGDTRAVEPLIAALSDNKPDVRSRAAQALGEMADCVGFPKLDWGYDPNLWPRRWPWRGTLGFRGYPLDDVRACHMSPDEEPLGMLPVSLFSYVASSYRIGAEIQTTYAVQGRRAGQIATAMGFESNYTKVFAPLLLCIANARVILRMWPSGKLYWDWSVEHLRQVSFDSAAKRVRGVAFEHPQQVLTLNFDDDDPLELSVGTGGWEKGGGELASWIEQCNRYLYLVHSRDTSALELYTQYMRGVNRGGLVVAEALIPALNDAEKEVRVAAADALKRMVARTRCGRWRSTARGRSRR
jgi:hypothetical protein